MTYEQWFDAFKAALGSAGAEWPDHADWMAAHDLQALQSAFAAGRTAAEFAEFVVNVQPRPRHL